MAREITLSGGQTVHVDLFKITRADYRALFDNKTKPAQEAAIVGKAIGMDGKDVDALPMPDWRTIVNAIVMEANAPIDLPNSPSGSTEESSA